MLCPDCKIAIPSTQNICPQCYWTSSGEAKSGRNVIHFLSSEGLNGLYSGWVQKYLQPELVKWNWHADSDEAFDEITGRREGEWHFLITDSDRIESSVTTLQKFRTTHPACIVAVLQSGSRPEAIPTGSILLDSPGDVDPWLAMMHALLRQT